VLLLIKHNVEYLSVGGCAVGVHGHPRYTGDLDIWINPGDENAEKLLQCINEFGFESYALSKSDLTKPGNVIQLGYPPLRIDLLTERDGVDFRSCYPNRKIVNNEELAANFIGLHDLLINKRASGRHRDLDDLENLDDKSDAH
jgi:hypothetical protein